jgi:hypothetical protein
VRHEGYVVDDQFRRLMVSGVNRMIGSLTAIYTLLRCELIDIAAAQVRVFCEALITLEFVARDPQTLAPQFWDYYTIESFETVTAMVELERGRARPEHIRAMEEWLARQRPEYERLRDRYTFIPTRGKNAGKRLPFVNWCNVRVSEQARLCGAELHRLYRLVYKQMSTYVHCTAFSLRRQTAYSRNHYDAGVVHRDIATLVRTTGIVWVEMARFLEEHLEWRLLGPAATIAEAIEQLDARHFTTPRVA